MQKHVKNIIRAFADKNDGHQRNLLIILLKMELTKNYESVLFDKCMTIWENINKQPSVDYRL
jgi:hypothetical protein